MRHWLGIKTLSALQTPMIHPALIITLAAAKAR
jgi:hypothetical protein